eukprot:TRINITY_DN1007_c0_g2_i2.p1 TRINITY_DN1007_c0_g2~~TRINITY_DN1007_c0_g2_i2.p1  ORF type:complete len:284 (+),score=85.96 TRINITY_DN1007_c0_g2_i2:29-853(+)
MNSDHPLLKVHQDLWPLLVFPSENTKERLKTWKSLLSTCQALRTHLLPLFITLNPLEYIEALQGYYIKSTEENDYYLHIHGNKLTFSIKHGVPSGRKKEYPTNRWLERSDVWELEREVVSASQQMLLISSSAFVIDVDSLCNTFGIVTMDRYKPIPIEYAEDMSKCTQEEFEEHKKKRKEIILLMRYCGAAVVTPNSPCCHEAISGIARGVIEMVPKDLEGYNDLLIKMSVVVEDLSQECMKNAMKDCEIHDQIVSNIVRIAPQLHSTLSKSHK